MNTIQERAETYPDVYEVNRGDMPMLINRGIAFINAQSADVKQLVDDFYDLTESLKDYGDEKMSIDEMYDRMRDALLEPLIPYREVSAPIRSVQSARQKKVNFSALKEKVRIIKTQIRDIDKVLTREKESFNRTSERLIRYGEPQNDDQKEKIGRAVDALNEINDTIEKLEKKYKSLIKKYQKNNPILIAEYERRGIPLPYKRPWEEIMEEKQMLADAIALDEEEERKRDAKEERRRLRQEAKDAPRIAEEQRKQKEEHDLLMERWAQQEKVAKETRKKERRQGKLNRIYIILYASGNSKLAEWLKKQV